MKGERKHGESGGVNGGGQWRRKIASHICRQRRAAYNENQPKMKKACRVNQQWRRRNNGENGERKINGENGEKYRNGIGVIKAWR